MINHQLRVLLVEDNPGDRRLAAEALSHDTRLELVAAATLAEATRRLSAARVDVVVLDLGLPDSQGLATFRRLREVAANLPFVVLSGDADDQHALDAVAEGAQDFLVKGSGSLDGLGRAIRHAVERHAVAQQMATMLRHRQGLRELAELSLEEGSEGPILENAARVILTGLDVDHAVVAELVDDDQLILRATGGWSEGSEGRGASPLLRAGVAYRAIRENGPVVVADVTSIDPLLADRGIVSAIATAIPNGDGPWGVLGAFTRAPRIFSPDDTDFLMAAAHAVAAARSRQTAEAAAQERIKELEGLAAIRGAVQDPKATLEQLGPAVTAQSYQALEQVPELGVELIIDGVVWQRGALRDGGRELVATIDADGRERGRLRAVHPDGRPFLLPHEQGLLRGIAETLGLWLEHDDALRDLTDREQQLAFLVNQLPGTLWATDRDLLLTSSLGRELPRLGVGPGGMVGRSLGDLFGSDDDDVIRAHRRALAGENASYTFAGDNTWHAHVAPLKTSDGTITGVIGVALDLTEQRHAEREAIESRRRLQGLFDNALEGILLIDDEGRYVEVNPALCELSRHPRDVLIGQQLGFLSDDPDGTWDVFDRMRRTGSDTTHDTLRIADGSSRDVQIHAVADIVPGLHLFSMRDVTEQLRAEASLRDSQARLETVMEQMPGIMWVVDGDLRVITHRGRGHETIGVEADSLIGHPAADVMGTDSAGLAAARRALEGEPTLYEEYYLDRWWETHASPLRAVDGTITGAIGVGLDVTEAKRTQRELDDARQRLQGLFDNALDAIILADDDGCYVDVNPAAEQLTGYPRDQLVGMRARDLAPSEMGDAADEAWPAFLEAGEAAGEFPIERADGRRVDAEFRAVANVVPGVHLSVLRDITERRRAEADLRQSEERFRRLAENAQDVIFRLGLGPEPAFEYISPAVEQMLGYTPQEFYDDPELAIRLVHPDDLDRVQPDLHAPVRRRGMTVRWQRRDGTYVWVEERHTYVEDDDGNIIASEGLVRDISDHVRIEEALRHALDREQQATEHLRQLDSLKNAFLTAVSHELRTPLTSILGFGVVLQHRGSELSEDRRTQLAERIVSNGKRLERLLIDLLDVDRLTHGVHDLNRATIDLGELIRRVVETVESGDHPIDVSGGDVEASVDVARVERIAEHLVHNAVHHTDPGTPIWVRYGREDDCMWLHVDDAGPGVPDHLKHAIFGHFQHGASAASMVGGTGIGLALVRNFAELHGGRIWVEDRPGGGASFRVELPDRAGTSAATTSRPVVAPGPAPDAQAAAMEQHATEIVAWASGQLLHIESPDEAAGIVLRVVHRLGGWTVPARLADEGALSLDLSFGVTEPILPVAEPRSIERLLLQRHLPGLVESARRAVDLNNSLQRLRQDATVDPLTGLANRRGIQRALSRVRSGTTLVAFDLDGFKAVNDQHGHAAGDEVLRSFADALRQAVRAVDHVGRLGGDEFVAILTDTDVAGGQRLLERLRTTWEATRTHQVGFSAGIATIDETDAGKTLSRADAALYAAKAAGKDRWMVAAEVSR